MYFEKKITFYDEKLSNNTNNNFYFPLNNISQTKSEFKIENQNIFLKISLPKYK